MRDGRVKARERKKPNSDKIVWKLRFKNERKKGKRPDE